MTADNAFTNLRSLTSGLARAMNLMNPEIERHHEQTAYMALFIAQELGLSEQEVSTALFAALLHDVGSITVESPLSLEDVEGDASLVAQAGAQMLAGLPGFEDIARVIAYSQCSWTSTLAAIEAEAECERLGRIASIVHLADVVSIMLQPTTNVLNQVKNIREQVDRCAGTEFCPEAVKAFDTVSTCEYVWMDLMHNPMFLTYFSGEIAALSIDQVLELTVFMSRLIDFRSPFTAMHSAGVAASAFELAKLAGFDEDTCKKVAIAGNLHDVGKLAVPRAILEKPGKLTAEEFNIIKEHPYNTAFVLMGIEGFEDIQHWASRHHEKLHGNGYPFHQDGLTLDTNDRIMAVADIFAAITEERPYRVGMTREQAAKVLREDVESGAICDDVVTLLLDNYEQVDAARDRLSHLAGKRYFDSLSQKA